MLINPFNPEPVMVFVPDAQKVAAAGITRDQLGYGSVCMPAAMTADSIKFADQGND